MPAKSDIHYQFAQYFTSNISLQAYLYALSFALQEGHICIDVSEGLPSLVAEEFNVPVDTPFELDEAIILRAPLLEAPFILDGNLLYFQRWYKYETAIAKFLETAMVAPSKEIDWAQMSLHFNRYFPNIHKDNTSRVDWQFVAALSAVAHPITFVTGGPGTGKTTTVSKMLAILLAQNPALKIAMVAPTGKAAARLTESMRKAVGSMDEEVQSLLLQAPASTIHRLLGQVANSIYFKHNAHNLLTIDVLVVDESSMIDVALFAKLLSAIPPNCKLIFLGDKNQLAAVEAGSMYGDLCSLFVARNTFNEAFVKLVEHIAPLQANLLQKNTILSDSIFINRVVTLEHSYRFSDEDGIGLLSKAIIENDTNYLCQYIAEKGNNHVVFDEANNTEVWHQFLQHYRHYIFDEQGQPRTILAALENMNHCMVLAAMREGNNGVYNLNVLIEQYLHKHNWLHIDGPMYNYKPIMITENNYQMEVYNGDVGLVFKDELDGEYKIHFWVRDEQGNSQIKKVLPSFLNAYETCYAMTIHKSQGSEYNHILMMLPNNEEHKLLTCELLYTGITRAKHSVVIQANSELFLQACATKVERKSGLLQRLK